MVRRADGAVAIVLSVIASAIFALPGYLPQAAVVRLLGLPIAIALLVFSGFSAGASRRRLMWAVVAIVTTCVLASSLWVTIGKPLWELWMRGQIGDSSVRIEPGLAPMIDGLRGAVWALAVLSIGVGLRMRRVPGAMRARD